MLQRPDKFQLYNTMHSRWPRGPSLRICVGDFPKGFDLPLAFLQGSGFNTYSFVAELMQELVLEPGQLSFADGASDDSIPLNAAPQAGRELAFNPVDSEVMFTWTHGPDGRFQGRPHPPTEAMDDTASLSPSQVTNLQVCLH
jgi:hypothetical protein